MAMIKGDYEAQGEREAEREMRELAAGNKHPLLVMPRTGTWQRKAWDVGYDRAKARLTTQNTALPAGNDIPAGSTHTIDIDALAALSHDWQPASREHVRRVAQDHNIEGKRVRRLRLFKVIGRQLERHGVTAPIPLF